MSNKKITSFSDVVITTETRIESLPIDELEFNPFILSLTLY